MRFAVVTLVLCACNQLYGLEPTEPLPIEPVFFDAPADAPFACPPIGQTPQFSRLFHQIPQTCTEWTGSLISGKALAMCFQPTMQIGQGPVEGPLAPIAGFETVNQVHFDAPRTLPDAEQVIIRRWDETTVFGEIRVYNRDANDALTYSHEIKLPSAATDSFVRYGSPSRGPKRRMFVRQLSIPLTEIEVDETGTSTQVATYSETDLDVTSFAGLPPSMTGDGLRIVFSAAGPTMNGIFYSDRASLGDRFRAASLLMGVPSSSDAFMTDDCERMYFSGLGSILYVQQL